MRQFSRIPFHMDALLSVGEQEFTGIVENLSMNGMLVTITEQLPTGQSVTVHLNLTGIEPPVTLTFSGVVSRQGDRVVGIAFDKIDPDSYGHLRNIIGYNSEDSETVFSEINRAIDVKYASRE